MEDVFIVILEHVKGAENTHSVCGHSVGQILSTRPHCSKVLAVILWGK